VSVAVPSEAHDTNSRETSFTSKKLIFWGLLMKRIYIGLQITVVIRRLHKRALFLRLFSGYGS
jgi:hypothetical protein